jgi:hypothetical protein
MDGTPIPSRSRSHEGDGSTGSPAGSNSVNIIGDDEPCDEGAIQVVLDLYK